jgi:glycosyltransferase involved in cell wall biosynthesis
MNKVSILESPLVTVFIPTYNRVQLLKRALESVLIQTYTNLEVIVVDDCSSDSTIDYLAEISKIDPRVRFFKNETNSGACVSRNKAINEAKGQFITALDDDDYFLSNRIEVFVNNWDGKNVLLFSDIVLKKNSGERIYKRKKYVCSKNLLESNSIGITFFVERSTAVSVFFDVNLLAWQDLDFCYRSLKNGDAKNVQNSTYVVDISHPHERISTRKIGDIEKTYHYLVKKYNLSSYDQNRLWLQCQSYDLESSSLFEIFKVFLLLRSRMALKVLVKCLLLKFKTNYSN